MKSGEVLKIEPGNKVRPAARARDFSRFSYLFHQQMEDCG